LILSGSEPGTATAAAISFSGTSTLDFKPGTRIEMTVSGSSTWAENAWNNNDLLYNGQSKSDLGSKSWADATDSGIGLGDGSYFVFDTDTLSLSSPSLQGYDLWATTWGTEIGAATNDHDADGLSNFGEYALGGDPVNELVQGTKSTFSKSGSGFIYVHPMRSDDPSLAYIVETTTNLTSGTWTNDGYIITGTNVTGETMNFVTNDIDMVEDEKFIRLKIEQ
jgi:hypothetical protein